MQLHLHAESTDCFSLPYESCHTREKKLVRGLSEAAWARTVVCDEDEWWRVAKYRGQYGASD